MTLFLSPGARSLLWGYKRVRNEKGVLEARSDSEPMKALVWFWLIDETLSANLVYQSDYETGSTTPSDEAMAKIMKMMMAC